MNSNEMFYWLNVPDDFNSLIQSTFEGKKNEQKKSCDFFYTTKCTPIVYYYYVSDLMVIQWPICQASRKRGGKGGSGGSRNFTCASQSGIYPSAMFQFQSGKVRDAYSTRIPTRWIANGITIWSERVSSRSDVEIALRKKRWNSNEIRCRECAFKGARGGGFVAREISLQPHRACDNVLKNALAPVPGALCTWRSNFRRGIVPSCLHD